MDRKHKLIGLYLIAIVLANLTITYFGIIMAIPVAFIFIGLDLTARDGLHEEWHKDKLFLKMLLLIFLGSLISYILNRNSLNIAIASFVAFLSAGIVDFITYSFLYNYQWLYKVNGSNLLSALTDSLVFPFLAFGGFLPLIVLGQFLAKSIGGFLWSLILKKRVDING